MDNTSLISLARAIATQEGCDPVLICAMIEQESNWNQWAIRYEPLFMSKYVAPLYTTHKITATEAWSRSFSWGLMQEMGQVAREGGYSGPLPQLCQPEVGLVWGCKLWVKKLASGGGDVTKGLLHWNGGGAPNYPTEVLARRVRYT
jgi:soluble lytic murein transglycosylase-like protein